VFMGKLAEHVTYKTYSKSKHPLKRKPAMTKKSPKHKKKVCHKHVIKHSSWFTWQGFYCSKKCSNASKYQQRDKIADHENPWHSKVFTVGSRIKSSFQSSVNTNVLWLSVWTRSTWSMHGNSYPRQVVNGNYRRVLTAGYPIKLQISKKKKTIL
jgi:hypothetical protein